MGITHDLHATRYLRVSIHLSRGLVLSREAEGREAHALDEHARGGEGVELSLEAEGEDDLAQLRGAVLLLHGV